MCVYTCITELKQRFSHKTNMKRQHTRLPMFQLAYCSLHQDNTQTAYLKGSDVVPHSGRFRGRGPGSLLCQRLSRVVLTALPTTQLTGTELSVSCV